MDDYLILLKDPRWVDKRNVIFDRDNHKCTVCGSNKSIEVHHTFYYVDYPVPWKYPDDSLITLCNKCHYEYHLHHESEVRPVPGKKRRKQKHKIKTSKLHKKKVKRISLVELQCIRGLRIKERQVK